jgi:hypothetical protein
MTNRDQPGRVLVGSVSFHRFRDSRATRSFRLSRFLVVLTFRAYGSEGQGFESLQVHHKEPRRLRGSLWRYFRVAKLGSRHRDQRITYDSNQARFFRSNFALRPRAYPV